MPTVVIVDDETAISDLLADVLAEFDHEVVTAVNGVDALRAIAALDKVPTLVLSDVMMPQMNGIELAKRLRADQRLQGVPVVLMTAAPGSVRAGIADAVVAKPFNLERLMALLQPYLESANSP
jgi:chemosensory pili system protein ChpA (sensor histidine kinase/response regulator)